MKRVLQVIGAVAVIGFVLSSIGDDDPTEPQPVAATEEAAADGSQTHARVDEPEPAAIGTPVRDGKFEFTVRSVKCGISEVGNAYLNSTAQGQYCAVELVVRNIGDKPQHMFSDNQKLFDRQGREFSPDSEALIYGNEDSDLWVSEINPGNEASGKLFFDVPTEAVPAILELHDSAFSGGVRVTLG